MTVQYRKSNRVWIVFIGCCVMTAVGFSIPTTTFSLFVVPISESLQIATSSVFLYYTAQSIGVIIATALTPQILKKLGAGKAIAITACLCALGLVGIAFMASPVTIPLFALLVGFALPISSIITVGILVNSWFMEKTGFFTGLAYSASGVGGAILSPITVVLIQSIGWQSALLVLALILVVAIVPFGVFVIRLSPLAVGILPYGATGESIAALSDAPAKEGGAKETIVLPGLSFKDARKSIAFVVLIGAFFLIGVVGAINTNVATLIKAGGYELTISGIAVSLAALGNVFGKILMGWINDHKGGAAASAVGLLLLGAGLSLYIVSVFVQSNELVYVAAFIGGLGSCIITILPPLLTGETFGRKDFAQIFGITSVFVSMGSMIVTPILGAVYDSSGSYLANLIGLIAVTIIIFPLVVLAMRLGQRKWKQARAEAETQEA
jgi:MFS family permease